MGAAPDQARYPVELFNWSPDSATVALRARARAGDKEASLFVAAAENLRVEAWGEGLTIGGSYVAPYARPASALWVDPTRLLVQAQPGKSGAMGWFLVGRGAANIDLSSQAAARPTSFHRAADGQLVGIAGDRLVAFDASSGSLRPLTLKLPAGVEASLVQDPDLPSSSVVVQSEEGGQPIYQRVFYRERKQPQRYRLSAGAELLELTGSGAIWLERTKRGLFVQETAFAGGARRNILTLNAHLAQVDWGSALLIDYTSTMGAP
jgi:hypothetical protein